MTYKEIKEYLKEEEDIPRIVLNDIEYNRKKITLLRNDKVKISKNAKVILALVATICIFITLTTNEPVRAFVEQALGIDTDNAVKTLEENKIPMNVNLTSTQNGREIKVTKFVSTKKKFAFDYQFSIDDDKLKTLLEKKSIDHSLKTMINIGLTSSDRKYDFLEGVSSIETGYVKNNTYFGSVIATFDNETIRENENLTLHVYNLSWNNPDEYELAKEQAEKEAKNSFVVNPAVKYEGDWTFNVTYKPILETTTYSVKNPINVTEVSAKGDALESIVTFKMDNIGVDGFYPGIEIYKDGVKLDRSSTFTTVDYDNNIMKVSFSSSALDKNKPVYSLKIKNTNDSEQYGEEIGSFDLN